MPSKEVMLLDLIYCSFLYLHLRRFLVFSVGGYNALQRSLVNHCHEVS